MQEELPDIFGIQRRFFMLKCKKTQNDRTEKMKKRKKLKRVFLVILGVLFLLYIGLANVLVSAALVPSFMERLEAFSRITQESVDALVHTDDIQQQYEKSWEDTQEWARNAHGQKLTKETEDGYKLVAQEVYTEEESHKWVLLLHGYTG